MSRPKAAIALSILAALLVGCSGSQDTYPPAPEQIGRLALAQGRYKTDMADYTAEYGTLLVPENRRRADSRAIELPLIRIRSSNPEPGAPIFYLAGGPGISNIKPAYPPDSLLARHDIVMVGYRGVDGPTVLDCPEGTEAMTADGPPLLSRERLGAIGAGWAACGQRLEESGIDLRGYNMLEVIADMETARAGLGYQRIHLLSRSYGTRVAYLYGLQHPQRIARSLMIGANPPGRFVWEPEIVEGQLQYYAGLWAKDERAAARSGDLLATMGQVLESMPDQWLFFDIDPGKVEVMTAFMLFHCSTAPYIFDAYIAAQEGDASGLALLSLAFNYLMPPTVVWGDLTAKAIGADFDTGRDYFHEMDPPDALLGSPLSKFTWSAMQFGDWPYDPIPEKYRRPRPSPVETLIINGSIDFSTPAENTENELMPYLENGRHVVLSEAGHLQDLLAFQPEARDHLVGGFLADGTVDASRYTHEPVDFEVGFSLGLIAKLCVAAVGVGVLVIAAIAFWIIRRVRRRKRIKG
ncbi:MAG: alpha/beta fold hydrolase [Candidatus Latescibacteria bacterium]|nr:alpha/beta fold hydrolase [Candidatus Latescibacterota bacterium]